MGRINPAQVKHFIVFLGNEQNDKLEIIAHNICFISHHEVITSTQVFVGRVSEVYCLEHAELREHGSQGSFASLRSMERLRKYLRWSLFSYLNWRGKKS